jgi:hypothetical protein
MNRAGEGDVHQRSALIEIVFDWGERVSPAVSVSGILLGRSMVSGAEWEIGFERADCVTPATVASGSQRLWLVWRGVIGGKIFGRGFGAARLLRRVSGLFFGGWRLR